jgi:probable H4MPT-linked C1 transfer pathway protein
LGHKGDRGMKASGIVPGGDGWVALDVGGANIKVAHEGGQGRTVPFEVWKRPDELGRTISAAVATLPPADRAALTMTAELCDCYPTKKVGVNAVLDAAEEGLAGKPIVVWGVDGEFHSVAEIRDQPTLAAAANWLTLATFAARLVPEEAGVLIDIGTTTTDLIPLDRGKVAARGRSDTERLQTGELVYAGIRRTPICALATELPFQGRPTGLAAEIFASTLDVYLTLGDIESTPTDLSTAGPRPSRPPATAWRGWSGPTAMDFRKPMPARSHMAPTSACCPGLPPRPGGPAGRRSAYPPLRSSPAPETSWPDAWRRGSSNSGDGSSA